VLLAGLVAPSLAFAGEERVTVAFDQDNLPYSSRRGAPEGVDVEIARLIALQMGVALDIHWFDGAAEGVLGIVGDAKDGVEMAVGVPIEPKTIEDEQLAAGDVIFSAPYAAARYVLITRKGHADVAELAAVRHEYIGVEVGSVASGRLWDEGYLLFGKPSHDELLDALASGEVGYAVLWNNSGWIVSNQYRDKLTVQSTPLDVNGMCWDVAVAVNPKNTKLLDRLNEAIAALRKMDAFKSFYLKYRIEYAEPRKIKGKEKP